MCISHTTGGLCSSIPTVASFTPRTHALLYRRRRLLPALLMSLCTIHLKSNTVSSLLHLFLHDVCLSVRPRTRARVEWPSACSYRAITGSWERSGSSWLNGRRTRLDGQRARLALGVVLLASQTCLGFHSGFTPRAGVERFCVSSRCPRHSCRRTAVGSKRSFLPRSSYYFLFGADFGGISTTRPLARLQTSTPCSTLARECRFPFCLPLPVNAEIK